MIRLGIKSSAKMIRKVCKFFCLAFCPASSKLAKERRTFVLFCVVPCGCKWDDNANFAKFVPISVAFS